MTLKEVTFLLGWNREQLKTAIISGIKTPKTKQLTKLQATPNGTDFDIKEEDVDSFLNFFESEEPGRNPPVAVRRKLLIEARFKCAICFSDAPPRFHHIVEWANLKHHDPAHMLAICGTCHDKIGSGQIDTIAQKEIKKNLSQQSRHTHIADHPQTIQSSESNITPNTPKAQPSDQENRCDPHLEQPGLKENPNIAHGRFNDSPASWFHHERLVAAFPGVRGLQEFTDPAEAMKRLAILLQPPLRWVWDENKLPVGMTPLWWWRGGNMSIDSFSKLSDDKALVNCEEILINRVVAVNDGAYWQSFVYVETKPQQPIGLYVKNPESDSKMMEMFGYLHEEYGLYKGHPITRAEYDDGAAIIEGKPVKTSGAELRIRYLSSYNFVIASHQSPINNNQFDSRLEDLLNGILGGKHTVQTLAKEVQKLPKRSYIDGSIY